MIKPFKYYVDECLVRTSTPNLGLARSLLKKSKIRFERIINKQVEKQESSIIFEDIYESLREATQALMEIKGYKPYSHEAIIAFLSEKKVLKPAEINVIDNYRILRNKSVYSAENISVSKCEEAVKFTKNILPKIIRKFEELSNKS